MRGVAHTALGFLAGALLVTGCGRGTTPPPRVVSVTPTSAAEGTSALLQVRGEHFLPTLRTDFGHRASSAVSAFIRMSLISAAGEELVLEGVELRDPQLVEGLVNSTTPRGRYDLKVEDARGEVGILASAFSVVTPAESVASFEFSEPGPQIAGVPFAVRLSALDERGRLVEDFSGFVDLSDDTGTLSPSRAGPFLRGRLQVLVTVEALTAATRLRAVDALGHRGDSLPFPSTSGEAAQLVWGSPPTNISAGTCVGPFELSTTDRRGHPSPVGEAVVVSLDTPNGGGTFFAEASCSSAVSAVTLSPPSAASRFFARLTRAPSTVLVASPTLYPAVDLALSVAPLPPIQLALIALPQGFRAGECSPALVAAALDEFGNASFPAAPTAIGLTLTPDTVGQAFQDGQCATALGPMQLDASQTQVTFFLRASRPGALQVELTGSGLTGTTADLELTP